MFVLTHSFNFLFFFGSTYPVYFERSVNIFFLFNQLISWLCSAAMFLFLFLYIDLSFIILIWRRFIHPYIYCDMFCSTQISPVLLKHLYCFVHIHIYNTSSTCNHSVGKLLIHFWKHNNFIEVLHSFLFQLIL